MRKTPHRAKEVLPTPEQIGQFLEDNGCLTLSQKLKMTTREGPMVATSTAMGTRVTDLKQSADIACSLYVGLIAEGVDIQSILGAAEILFCLVARELIDDGGAGAQHNKDTLLNCLDAIRREIENIPLSLEAIQ